VDLTADVKLKKIPREFQEYSSIVKNEELSSINYLNLKDALWTVPQSLSTKVDFHGNLKPYFGDTVVLKLKERDKIRLSKFQESLLEDLADLFAEPLDPAYFHITLHDLNSSTDEFSLTTVMDENRLKCEKIFKEVASYFKKNPQYSTVTLKPLYIYPCCNISIVAGFTPLTDHDFRIIMNLYNLFDEVRYLDYWLRLHATLCYFKPRELTGEEIRNLYNKLKNLSMEDFTVKLNLWELAYERFFSMNRYSDVFLLSDFSQEKGERR